jgi:hypothetical protein
MQPLALFFGRSPVPGYCVCTQLSTLQPGRWKAVVLPRKTGRAEGRKSAFRDNEAVKDHPVSKTWLGAFEATATIAADPHRVLPSAIEDLAETGRELASAPLGTRSECRAVTIADRALFYTSGTTGGLRLIQ